MARIKKRLQDHDEACELRDNEAVVLVRLDLPMKHPPQRKIHHTITAQEESAKNEYNDDHPDDKYFQHSTTSAVSRRRSVLFSWDRQIIATTTTGCSSAKKKEDKVIPLSPSIRHKEVQRMKMTRPPHQLASESFVLALGSSSSSSLQRRSLSSWEPIFQNKKLKKRKQEKILKESTTKGLTKKKKKGKTCATSTSVHRHFFICLVIVISLMAFFPVQARPLLGISSWPSSPSSSATNTKNVTTTPSGIYWTNLSVQTADGSYLLNKCHGHVQNGHICGVLGPSGAGKSTTLSAIAGGGAISTSSPNSSRRRSGLQIQGHVQCYDSDKKSKEHLRMGGGKVAWLQQQDSFFHMLTVQETLQFAAFLELPNSSKKQRQQTVLSLMESLGLAKLAPRKVEGLSGGEKRRLSLALELLSSPSLFIGDEPTSGLDSTMSAKVVRLIQKSVQERNIPAILSLHQPRSSIFKMLDSCLVLAPGGHVVYMGKAKDAVEYFTQLGYGCPVETNPAEFLLDLVSVDSEDPVMAREDEKRISHLATAFLEHQQSSQEEVDLDLLLEKAVSLDATDATKSLSTFPKRRQRPVSLFRPIQRFGRLLLRSWRQNIRNHRVNMYRLLASGGTAYLFTNIFRSIKKGVFTSKSVADRVALLSFSVINMRYVYDNEQNWILLVLRA